MFNVGFLSSGLTRACLNAVGKMPVRRDVLIMCVSAGRSVGEIAWRRCEGIGSRGHVVGWLERRSLDTSASVRGQKEKMGVSNQIKSLLLSHHHSTSALVSEILMSVLQTVQKNNRQFTYGQTVQKKQQTIYIWTDSAKKLHWSIYSAPDSAKKTTTIYIWTDSAKKNNSNLHMDRQCKKQQQFTYGQYIFTDCTEDNVQNTHTYTQYA